MNSLYQLILVHLRTFVREPAILFWAILFPILMAWILGIAFSSKGETSRTVYVAGDNLTQLSGTKVMGKETGNPFRIKFQRTSEEEALRAIKRGIISLYITSENDSVKFHFDPLNSDAQVTHLILERELNGIKSEHASIHPLETKGTRYIDFLIPGLIALGIMNSCLWGISWNLIETRMKKLLRRMVATPMRKSVFLASHVVTRVLLGGLETLLLLLFARWYFDIEVTGSITAFVIVFLSGVFAFSGIGILVASRTDKSEIGNGLINAVTLPMMILSGIFFNYHNFPDWAVSFIQVLPLTMVADAIRAIVIESAGVSEVTTPALLLTGSGLLAFITGLRMFKWY